MSKLPTAKGRHSKTPTEVWSHPHKNINMCASKALLLHGHFTTYAAINRRQAPVRGESWSEINKRQFVFSLVGKLFQVKVNHGRLNFGWSVNGTECCLRCSAADMIVRKGNAVSQSVFFDRIRTSIDSTNMTEWRPSVFSFFRSFTLKSNLPPLSAPLSSTQFVSCHWHQPRVQGLYAVCLGLLWRRGFHLAMFIK